MQLKSVIIENLSQLRGILCRKRWIESWLQNGVGSPSGFNIYKNKKEQLYQDIAKKYNEIRVHSIYSERIGEYGPRLLAALQDAERNAAKGILDVIVPSNCINHNSMLSKIIGRNIPVIDETNVDVWEYILIRFRNVKFLPYWNDYLKHKDALLNPADTVKYFKTTEEEEQKGQYKKELMGLHMPYICISNRDNAYLDKIVPYEDWTYHDYRDSDINLCALAAEYLRTCGITTVRMGRIVKNAASFDNCIDYASNHYDELMDIILMRDCKFYVGDANGTCFLPMALNKPFALKNATPVFINGFYMHPQSPNNIMIFKKHYSKTEKRFLSIREMMHMDVQCRMDAHKYAEKQIELVENSAEEILDLVMEMNARLDGEWVETLEDSELQKKYHDIFWKLVKEAGLNENLVWHGRVGTMFLKKNLFLLD